MAICITLSSSCLEDFQFGNPHFTLSREIHEYLSCDLQTALDVSGRAIDLYDGAEFRGQALESLERRLQEAARRVETEDDIIKVHLGSEVSPSGERRELSRELSKKELREGIAKFLGLIKAAKQQGLALITIGD